MVCGVGVLGVFDGVGVYCVIFILCVDGCC